MEFQNDLDKLLAVMPPKVLSFVTVESLNDVIELVLDVGRPPEVRHSGGKIDKLGTDNLCTLFFQLLDQMIICHGSIFYQNLTYDADSGLLDALVERQFIKLFYDISDILFVLGPEQSISEILSGQRLAYYIQPLLVKSIC